MALVISASMVATMAQEAVSAYPQECCGLMLGRRLTQADGSSSGEDDRQVMAVVSANNRWDASVQQITDPLPEGQQQADQSLDRQRRYWIDPEMMLNVQKQARDRDLDIIGVYHSHPDHPAIPSECDRRMAWPVYSYVIFSVIAGQSVDWGSWQLDEDHQFRSETVKIVDEVSP